MPTKVVDPIDIIQTMNSDRLTSLSMNCEKLKLSGNKDIGIRKFECVVKAQTLLC